MTFRTGEEKETIVAAGSITRYAEDIMPFMKLLFDKNVSKLELDSPVDFSKLTVAYIVDPGDMRVSPVCKEIRDTIRKAAAHFRDERKANAPAVKEVIPINNSFRFFNIIL